LESGDGPEKIRAVFVWGKVQEWKGARVQEWKSGREIPRFARDDGGWSGMTVRNAR
jgi:hypothetical protein